MDRSDAWTLSDKIAVIASIVALLQFFALVATIFAMMRTAKRQLRAYICLYGGSIRLLPVENQTFVEAYVRLKNCGQTPAYGHRCWVRMDVTDAAKPPFDISENCLTRDIIGPDGEANLPVHWGPISAQNITDIRNETKRIFVWGRADYIDAFGEERYFKFHFLNAKELPGKGWPLVPSDKPNEAN